jgi:hypothetical protein
MIMEEHLQVVQVAQEMLMELVMGITCTLKVHLQTTPVVLDIIGLECHKITHYYKILNNAIFN